MISQLLVKHPRRHLFNFLKKGSIESTQLQKQLDQSELAIKPEETKLLWDLYQPKEEEGLEVFDNALSNQIQEFNTTTQSKELTQMTRLIDQTNRKLQMKYKREHKYELQQHEERLYKEVIYDTRPLDEPTYEEEHKFMNPLKRANKGGTRIRNLNEVSAKAQQLAVAPGYQRRMTTTIVDGEKVHDPYDYFRQGPLSKEDDQGFMMQEQTFMNLMLMKNDYLTKQIWREQDYYQYVPHALPMLIDGEVYFRKIDNPADSLTIYKTKQTGKTDLGEIPELDDSCKIVFNLQDLITFYERYAVYDPRIKDFCEKITEMVKTGDHAALLHSFQTHSVDSEIGKANLAVIVLDTEGTGKSFDIIVKDLDQNVLMPVLILNSDGQVAFDQLAGFYYTQVDASGLGKRVFRH